MKNMVEQIGGEEELRLLVNTFYDLIETLPDAKELHKLHSRGFGMSHLREEQFNFLSGFMGGHPFYAEKYGHMNVREIHAHIPIRQQDAEVWLRTFDQALTMRELSGPHIQKLRTTLHRVAFALVNEVEDWRT